jgi:hypothetical protein
MQPFPVDYEPDLFKPCLSIRSRREQNSRETVNARHVEQWLSDGPTFRGGMSLDTHGLSSRLYREDIDRHPQWKNDIRTESKLTDLVTDSLAKIQKLEGRIRTLSSGQEMDTAVKELKELYGLYNALVESHKVQLTDSFGKNPYFEKFDVSSDSRNVARELRSVVYEDIDDRGVAESKKLLERSFESRWSLPKVHAGPNHVEAFELLRPSINQMNKVYNF